MEVTKITPVLMPKWGLSMQEGLLGEWLVEEGDEISVGDEIMEVETDKISSAVEAADSGILRRQVAEAGETYPVRALMGVLAPLDVSDDDISSYIDAFEVPEGEDEDAEMASEYLYLDTAAGRLRYAQRGEDGPAVILIHGFGGDLDNWLFNIDALAQKARVYALDLPGHGQSVKLLVDPSLSGLAAALRGFMEAINVETAHLVGHSMGAAVAARLACDSPDLVQSLSLISAAGLGSEINSNYIDGFSSAVSRRELKPVLLNLFADPELVNRSMIDDLLKYKRIDGVADALAKISAELFVDGIQQNLLAEQIAGLGMNTLVIWGVSDQIIPVAHANNIEAARVELLEDAGHMVQMEQATRVNELILGHILGQ